MTNWILAEIFESVNTDNFGGKFAYLLANQGVDYILDLTLHELATDVLDLSPEQIKSWGLDAPQLNQVFSPANILNLVFKAAIGTVLPDLESTEAQIGSGLITIALDVFAGIGGFWGAVLGYVGGLFLDLFFDKDPEAFTYVGYDAFTGKFEATSTTSDDGGNKALANGMAVAFVDFVNGVIERAQSSSHNLAVLEDGMDLYFGHREETFLNGNGQGYATGQDAVTDRIVEVLSALEMIDGDVKFAEALKFLVENSSTDSEALLHDLSMRLQVASDYQAYLENKEFYDKLIAANPDSAFTAGWETTFLLAKQYGYMKDFDVEGDDASGTHITSAGDDVVNALGGDDVIRSLYGNDRVNAGSGNDIIYGGSGNDILNGQSGDDVIYSGSRDNTLRGGGGIDTFYIGLGNNTVYGGNGKDLITFDEIYDNYTVVENGDNTVTVTHDETGAVTQLDGVEFLLFKDMVVPVDPSYDNVQVGTIEDDLLKGTDLKDALNGLAGDDVIYGFDGDDFISGDAGDDQLFGGAGDDWIFGVLGNDVLKGEVGNDRLDGGEHGDFLWGGTDNDNLYGQGGGDVLFGDEGHDKLYGGLGDDVLEGGDGNDELFGESGDDDLFGGSGVDVLSGANGDLLP